MNDDRETIRQFFNDYGAAVVGTSPPQPIQPNQDEDMPDRVELDVEIEAADWHGLVVPEAPARDGEFPVRFIDGSQANQPVLWLRAPAGCRCCCTAGDTSASSWSAGGSHHMNH